MRRPKTMLVFLLLIWTLAEFVSCQAMKSKHVITVRETFAGIEIHCPESITKPDGENASSPLALPYEDEFTGEYSCMFNKSTPKEKIYVKFRTCENCIDVDILAIGVIVAVDLGITFLIGIAVYFINSRATTSSSTTGKKSSDKQHLISNESSSRGSSDTYQRLRPRERDEYDVVANRK
ncbi:T-cell surface glycoprotein CD3 gamma chain-like [Lampris incognitus]|uniref:T-cell surface glycoprotein CD3 gamma chain-like n=1 Tax=Lampris incognitus TaxID=2546036 RepID=UPI0024B4870F|nr:T-cell surface glycoprotein CD3 gamma chain-like [Lampris incognitus]XP_056140047.1 T-cell surface glycoprotein CD3 gamma chain-like [Lampris incognitus]